MKLKIYFICALLWSITSFAQTFTSGGINYNITSATAPFTVEVGDNGDTNPSDGINSGFVGHANIPSSVTNGGNSYTVTRIGYDAFFGSSSLTAVTIPNTVTSIGYSAFQNTGLTAVTIPNSVTIIGDFAFGSCFQLTSVNIPNAVTSIGEFAFGNCNSLPTINIPSSVNSIGINAFYNCTALTSVTVNWQTPLTITANVFSFVTLANVTLNVPQGKAAIYDAAPVWTNFNIVAPPALAATHLNFDGINDYVTLPLDITKIPTTNFTHEFWFQTYDLNGTMFTASTGPPINPSGWDRSIYMNNGKVSAYIFNGALNTITSPLFYNDGYWHHVAHVVNATGSFLYIDGAVVASNTVAASTFNSNTAVTLGISPLAGGSFFSGNIDEVRVWNVAKTASQIAGARNCELLGTEAGLVAYYKCNQGLDADDNTAIIRLTDAITSSNNGTLGVALTGTTSNFLAGSPVTTGVTVPTAPTAVAQNFTVASTVANLVPAPSATLKWYDSATGVVALATNTALVTGNYYAAAVNSGGCESARTEVAVTVNLFSLGQTFTVAGINYIVTKATLPYEVAVHTHTGFTGAANIPASVTNTGFAFGVTGIGVNAFTLNIGLTSITIPNSVTSIGDLAFYSCTGLTSVTIPNSVTSIGEWAFAYCLELTSVTIPSSVNSIGINAFYGCTALTSVTVNWATPLTINANVFQNVTLNNVTLNVPAGKAAIYDAALVWTNFNPIVEAIVLPFVGQTFTAGGINYIVTKATLPYEVAVHTHISFIGAANIPASVTNTGFAFGVMSIGNSAFANSTGLNAVTIPNSVTSIEYNAFNSSGLTSIVIPNSVTSIGYSAFGNCTGLTSAVISNAVTEIKDGTFGQCTSLITVTLPNALQHIGVQGFYKCGFSSINLPNTLVSIDNNAFNGCSNLTSINFPSSLTSIGNFAFADCFALNSVTVNWATPLGLQWGTFFSLSLSSIRLNVPLGRVLAYQAAAIWQNFNPIIEQLVPATHLNFDGTNDSVTLPVSIANTLSSGQEITIEYWFKGTNLQSGVRFQNGGNWIVAGYGQGTGAPSFIVSTDGGISGVSCGPAATINNDAWHHLSFVWKKNTTFATYLDGVLQNTRVAADVNLPTFSNVAGTIGSFIGTSEFLSGNMDDVRIWNVARTADQIAGSRSCELIGNETGLLAYYKFNQGNGAASNTAITTVTNAVSSSNNGTLTNFARTGTTSNFLAGSPVTTGVTVPAAPTAVAQSFCSGSTVANLVATGTTIKWYATATDGTALAATTVLASGNYFASQTSGSCESTRTAVAVTVNVTPAPTANQSGGANGDINVNINSPSCFTVSGLYFYDGVANGKNIYINTQNSQLRIFFNGSRWVLTHFGLTEYENTTVPSGLFPPAVGWTINAGNSLGCTGTMTIDLPPSSTAVCAGATIANLTATGTALKWYNTATNGTVLTTTTALAAGTYYVSQTLNGCESVRTAVNVVVNPAPAAPTPLAQNFTVASTVANLVPAPSETLKWYNVATGGTALNSTTALVTGNYYAAAVNSNGCESARTEVAVTVNLVALGNTFTVDGINYIVTKATVPYEVAVHTHIGFTGAANIPASFTNTGFAFGVTSIGNSAFENCTGLTSVTIPNSVTSIGSGAFYYCIGLTSVTIPNSVTSIREQTFENCTGLTSVTIPNSVTIIGDRAFRDCSGLTSVSIPNSVTSIGTAAFRSTGLVSAVIPNSITVLPFGLFYSCASLTSVTIPSSVTSIGESAFEATALTTVNIPSTVTTINGYAFYGCTALTSVTVNWATPLSIAATVFETVTLSNVTLNVPAGKAAIYDAALVWTNFNPIVEAIVLPFVGQTFTVVGINYIVTKATLPYEVAVHTHTGFTGAANIPDSVTNTGFAFGVTSIKSDAFYNNTGLTAVTIPTSVISIGTNALRNTGLVSVVIPNSITVLPFGLFHSCASLTSVTIPSSVTSIGESAFEATALTTVNIPSTVTTINGYAFYGCTALTSVTVNWATPLSIAATVFETVTLSNVTLNVPAGKAAIYDAALVWTNFNPIVEAIVLPFVGQTFTVAGINYIVTKATLPYEVAVHTHTGFTGAANIPASVTNAGNSFGVTSIGVDAFSVNGSLNAITIPSSVKSIGNGAFYATDLASVTIPNSVTSIGNYAFGLCALTSITIPDSVISIGDGAFSNCSQLASVIIPNSVISIGNSLFEACISLVSVTIPNSVTTIGPNTFRFCTQLTTINIPSSITSIGQRAFSGCTALTSVTVNWATPLSINANVFQNVTLNTVTLNVPAGKAAIYDAALVWTNFNPIVEASSSCVTPAPIAVAQSFCDAATVADLVATGTGTLKWYDVVSVGTALNSSTALVTGTYYVSQTTTCESARTAVAVTVNTTTWNGTAWSNGIPDASKGAVISGNYSAATDLTSCSLEVTGTAIVTVPTGFDFNISGKVTVASTASLTFENTANLLQTSTAVNIGNINIKRNTAVQRLAYTNWSSPVANQNALAFSPLTASTRFLTYNEATNTFAALLSPSTTNLIPAVGYGIRAPNTFADAPAAATPFVGTFTGVPNNGNYSYAATKIADGYNLVGNPYPSAMLASSFFAANPNVTALHFWNNSILNAPTGTNYATRNLTTGTRAASDTNSSKVPTDFIAVGQGFFAKVNAAATLSFTNAMRSSDNTSAFFFRNATTEKHLFKLNLLSPTATHNQIAVGYLAGATTGLDSQYDAVPFAPSTTMVSSLINNVDYVIQGRSLPFVNTDVVPLGFKTNVAGNYSFTTEAFEGIFNNNQNIFLKDNLAGITHNVKQSPYQFTTNAGTFNSRFEIVYVNSVLGTENPNFNDNSVFVFVKDNNININSGTTNMKNIQVFDIRGRLVFEKRDVNATAFEIQKLTVAQAVLLVKITSENGQIVSKKIIF